MFLLIFYTLMTLTLNDWQQFMLSDVNDYFAKTEYKNVAVTIDALGVLETGWYKSEIHDEFKNAFSMKQFDKSKQHHLCKTKPIYCMKQYKTYEDCYKDLLNYFKRNKYPTDKKGFLDRMNGVGGLKYAEDKDHVKKIKSIEWVIRTKYLSGNYKSIH